MTSVFSLQECLVSIVHPSWLAPISEELIVRCKQQIRGRRWLAQQLTEWSELVNTLSSSSLETGLVKDPLKTFWLTPDPDWDSRVSQHLGAMIYAPVICKTVSGDQVRTIAGALGNRLYKKALKFGLSCSDNTAKRNHSYEFPTIASGGDWHNELRLQGFSELLEFAFRRHPLLAERVKLAQSKDWATIPPGSRLKDLFIEECVLDVMKGSEE